jgi:hypothetical protein
MFRNFTLFLLILLSIGVSAQQRATVSGVVRDDVNKPITGAEIYLLQQSGGTLSDSEGRYELSVPANINLSIIFKFLGYINDTVSVKLNEGQRFEVNPKLLLNVIAIKQVDIEDKVIREAAGTIRVDVAKVSKIPTPLGGIEGALVTQALGVSSTNEMSSSYSVRGGNYDENLIYVNDFEVYRPFLIRSGQNEGMSFINADMVQSVEFSSGGFQARYGDKMSSVLDVKYKRPKEFGGSVSVSLMFNRT